MILCGGCPADDAAGWGESWLGAPFVNSMPACQTERPLIGISDAMRSVFAYADKVARTDATVLLTGETGTGKENLAHYIHSRSARRDKRIVCVNCSTVPDALFEGEMFGYERGSFTGADHVYKGKLLLAQGGTVFLDEIGELTAAAQAKFLRVLESHEVFRLGARFCETLDVRIIAATNQDLEELVSRKMFRSDLFFRLNVARVHVPPLSARRDDIPTLIAYYVTEMTRRTGTKIADFSPETLECLVRYQWPGNVRELRNVIEALFIDPPNGAVGLQHLPPNLTRQLTGGRNASYSERERIVATLLATRWNKCRAAEQLRWSRMTLYRKMAKYGINTDGPPN
jgi:transcriptional regulator with PAS, ATPase and Fis domain